MKRLEILPAIAEQVKDIVALDRLCFAGIWSENGYLREIKSPNSSLLLLWLTEDQSNRKMIGIGCLWSILSEAHITLLGIHPEYQQQGLGKLLLYTLLQDGVARGLERASLEVKATNQPAIKLYEQVGFQFAGKRKNYYSQTGEDALIMWLKGLNSPDFWQQLDTWQANIYQRLNTQYLLVTN